MDPGALSSNGRHGVHTLLLMAAEVGPNLPDGQATQVAAEVVPVTLLYLPAAQGCLLPPSQ